MASTALGAVREVLRGLDGTVEVYRADVSPPDRTAVPYWVLLEVFEGPILKGDARTLKTSTLVQADFYFAATAAGEATWAAFDAPSISERVVLDDSTACRVVWDSTTSVPPDPTEDDLGIRRETVTFRVSKV